MAAHLHFSVTTSLQVTKWWAQRALRARAPAGPLLTMRSIVAKYGANLFVSNLQPRCPNFVTAIRQRRNVGVAAMFINNSLCNVAAKKLHIRRVLIVLCFLFFSRALSVQKWLQSNGRLYNSHFARRPSQNSAKQRCKQPSITGIHIFRQK